MQNFAVKSKIMYSKYLSWKILEPGEKTKIIDFRKNDPIYKDLFSKLSISKWPFLETIYFFNILEILLIDFELTHFSKWPSFEVTFFLFQPCSSWSIFEVIESEVIDCEVADFGKWLLEVTPFWVKFLMSSCLRIEPSNI